MQMRGAQQATKQQATKQQSNKRQELESINCAAYSVCAAYPQLFPGTPTPRHPPRRLGRCAAQRQRAVARGDRQDAARLGAVRHRARLLAVARSREPEPHQASRTTETVRRGSHEKQGLPLDARVAERQHPNPPPLGDSRGGSLTSHSASAWLTAQATHV